jgi:hypothetical protein
MDYYQAVVLQILVNQMGCCPLLMQVGEER